MKILKKIDFIGKHRKMFSVENIFRKNDLSENIFLRKLFYVKVNGA
jgi:hypothetical protein